jgi:hypothetical protein
MRDMRAPDYGTDPAEQTDRLRAKFLGLAGPVLGAERTDALARSVDTLDALADVRTLCRQARA